MKLNENWLNLMLPRMEEAIVLHTEKLQKILTICVLSALLIAGGVRAFGEQSVRLASPQDDPVIDGKLFEFSLAFELERKCTVIKGRLIKVFFFYQGAYKRAKNLGFSKKFMDDYIDNKTNQARMQKRIDAYLIENDVDLTKEADYCDFARRQIADKTATGRLLRIKR